MSGGALVVFGPEALRTLEDLKAQGALDGTLALCALKAEDLAMPAGDLAWAMALFDHDHRGPGFWDKVAFHMPGEPRPGVHVAAVESTGGALLTLEWLTPVSADQVKRAAVAAEDAYFGRP